MKNGLPAIFFSLLVLLTDSNFVHFNDRLIDKIYSESTNHDYNSARYFFIYVYDQPTL